MNTQFEFIRQSPTVSINDRIVSMKTAGHNVIALQVGDPDFATPQAIIDVGFRYMKEGLTHYASSQGIPELRFSAALKLQRDNVVHYDQDSELLVTHGGIHAYYVAMQSILNPGDDVLIPDPSWATHVNMVVMLRGNVIRVPAPAENGFIPTFESWEKALTSRSRAIVINYPSNPTGAYPSRSYLQKLHDFASSHNLWIVSDEVYENLYYAEKPTSAAAFPGVKEHTLVVHSLSKTYAMTGWRVGYLAAPAKVIENALKASQNSITCVAPSVQKAAAFALSDPGIQEAAAKMRKVYARRRQRVLDIAREVGESPVQVAPPMGAFYFFLDLRALNLPSLQICERILAEAGVGLVPGASFGEHGEGFVRMSTCASDSDLEAGFRAILEWAERQ